MNNIKSTDTSWTLMPESPATKKVDISPVAKIITSPKAWEQYMSDDLYIADKQVRQLLKTLSATPEWKKVGAKGSAPYRKYTAVMVFERLHGRKVEHSDVKELRRIAACCKYYANRIVRNTSILGKVVKNRDIFVFAVAGIPNVAGEPKVPYSLKLRLEYYTEKGILPERKNMTLDEKELLDWTKGYRARNQAANKRSLGRTIKMRKSYYDRQNNKD